MSAHYDDPHFFYEKYWQSRSYEQASEEIALKRLLKNHHFSAVADIGGGYGRLSKFLTPYAKQVILVEPSLKQLNVAKKYLHGYLSLISLKKGTAERTGISTHSLDAIVMVRVMHHLPNPEPAFAELNRILKPGGILILEVANSVHFKSRLKAFISGHPILPTPIERRSHANIRRHTIPFVNHHPHTVLRQLNRSGFTLKQVLSVSNFRSPAIKNIFSLKFLLFLESQLQSLLAHIYFGPSIFLLLEKNSK